MSSSSNSKKQQKPISRTNKRSQNFGSNSFKHPPQICPQLTQSHRLRFTSNGVVNNNITFRNLLDTINIATAANVAYALYDQVRIKAIELWFCPAQGSTQTQILLQFGGQTVGQSGDGKIYSDSPVGVEPAHMRCYPEQGSQASMWQVSSAATAFSLVIPSTTIVDVTLDLRTLPALPPTLTQVAPAGATVGNIYFRGLDGLASGSTQLPPQATPVD